MSMKIWMRGASRKEGKCITMEEYALENFEKDPEFEKWIPPELCRLAYTEEELREIVIDEVGMPLAFRVTPFKYATSTNFIAMLASLSGGAGGAIWGATSDKVGRKICMLICHIGGIGGYALMYISGVQWNSYWGYVGGLTMNGLFSGSAVMCSAYILDTMSKEESEAHIGTIMLLQMLGGTAGALILMPFIEGRAENLFLVTFVPMIGTAFSFFCILIFLSEPNKKRAENNREEADRKTRMKTMLKDESKSRGSRMSVSNGKVVPEDIPPVQQGMTALSKKIVVIAVIASTFDNAGDEGTRIARGTVLQNVWPATNDLKFQNYLLLSLIGLIFCAMAQGYAGKAVMGWGKTALFGAFATLATQLALNARFIKWESYVSFLACWYCGKYFGFLSTLGAQFVVMEYAPPEEAGFWTGHKIRRVNSE